MISLVSVPNSSTDLYYIIEYSFGATNLIGVAASDGLLWEHEGGSGWKNMWEEIVMAGVLSNRFYIHFFWQSFLKLEVCFTIRCIERITSIVVTVCDGSEMMGESHLGELHKTTEILSHLTRFRNSIHRPSEWGLCTVMLTRLVRKKHNFGRRASLNDFK
jgi:hypothetical protein